MDDLFREVVFCEIFEFYFDRVELFVVTFDLELVMTEILALASWWAKVVC